MALITTWWLGLAWWDMPIFQFLDFWLQPFGPRLGLGENATHHIQLPHTYVVVLAWPEMVSDVGLQCSVVGKHYATRPTQCLEYWILVEVFLQLQQKSVKHASSFTFSKKPCVIRYHFLLSSNKPVVIIEKMKLFLTGAAYPISNNYLMANWVFNLSTCLF